MSVTGQHIVNQVVTTFIPLVLSLAIHEWGHAMAARALGDATPREQGRLTFNPVVHLDWFGSFVLPLGLIVCGLPVFGWAKPVQVSPQRFSPRIRMRTGIWLTAAAGPAMNLLLAAIGALCWVATIQSGGEGTGLALFTEQVFTLNVVLFVLNLLPIPPLDGSRVIRGVFPTAWQRWGGIGDRVGPVVLAVVLFTGTGAALLRVPSLALDARLEQVAVSVLHWTGGVQPSAHPTRHGQLFVAP